MPRQNHPVTKDMYWFAHGGAETGIQRPLEAEEEPAEIVTSPVCRGIPDLRSPTDDFRAISHTDGSGSSGPSSLEDRLHANERRVAVEERRKQLLEAEQERNEAVLRKHMERGAALEAKRNAQRSTISFAFGSSVPRNIDTLNTHQGSGDADPLNRLLSSIGSTQKEENHDNFWERRSVSPVHFYGHISHSEQPDTAYSLSSYYERKIISPPPCWLVGSGALVGEDLMSTSMSASIPAPRGRRKNDLMPTVPYDRTATPRTTTTTSSHRKRSVSMTRLDQLAMPRKHYVEATKTSSGSNKENVRSPTRPLSSASEHSGGCSNRTASTVTRRLRTAPRKPRPVSIAGTIPDQKLAKTPEFRLSPIKRNTPLKKTPDVTGELKKTPVSTIKTSTPIKSEKVKPSPRPSTAPKLTTSKPTPTKPSTPRTPKITEIKPAAKQPTSAKAATPKTSTHKKAPSVKVKSEAVVALPAPIPDVQPSDTAVDTPESASPDADAQSDSEKNNSKRIISEEEAKAALAEKRRLAREQAEKEAELERQRQEDLQRAEEERLRIEEEERMRQEQLMIEHRKQEEEKLQKAIQEQQQKEEEERIRKEEEMRTKAEQEKKAKEEAEKQRIELEEKLRKEEEERAERKKRLEKIMSRTRGKSNGTSPSGSISGSDQLDNSENPQDDFSSEANSLDSKEDEPNEEPIIAEDKSDNSIDANPTYEVVSEGESLNSNDLMMPANETDSQDNSLIMSQSNVQELKNDEALSQQLESEVKAHTSLNVHAPEFTPFGFGSQSAGSYLQEQTTFHEPQQSEAFVQETVSQAMEVPSEKQVTITSDTHFQIDNFAFETTASQSSESDINDIVNVDDSSNVNIGFQLPDPEMDIPDSNPRSSISSDIKLPDPIYETSDDGSVSSERFHHDFKGYSNDDLAYSKVQGNSAVPDDVFPDQVSTEPAQQFNPFEKDSFSERSGDSSAVQEPIASHANPFETYYDKAQFDMAAGFYDMNTSSHDMCQEHEDQISPVRSVPETDVHPSSEASDVSHFDKHSETLSSNNEFLTNQPPVNTENPFYTTSDFNSTNIDVDDTFIYQQQNMQSDQIDVFAKPADNQTDLENITLIKADNSESCIGIISSIDNDHANNDFPRASLNKEQPRTNFECSVTDSENSSLDSNLSQVEGGKRDQSVGLNGDSVHKSNANKLAYNNGDSHLENGLVESNLNGSSKTNGNHFFTSDAISNGHRTDQIEHGVGSRDILDADPLGGKMFENEVEIEFGIGSADPFLAKGASKQNPFLVQDDQKHVITSEFN